MKTTSAAVYAGVEVKLWEGKSSRELADLPQLPEKIAADVPQIARGKVWCLTCGASRDVDGAACLAHGWPKCCGHTMTIDSPDERRERKCG